MKIDIITIFPDFFKDFLSTSIVKRAIEKELITINIHDLRDYAFNKHRQIDDTIYGGGAGMLMTFPPFYEILKVLKTSDSYTIYLSPQGSTYNQAKATSLAHNKKHLILICGHYEGLDERVLEFVDEQISIGDYILTGGEIPAMILVDSLTRLIPGVINEESYLEDTFQNGLLKYAQYTKPLEYEGYKVPDILTSGHHENIRIYRLKESLKKTLILRPDLLCEREFTEEEQKILKIIKKEMNNK